MTPETWTAIGTAVIAVATGFAAVAAMRAARATLRTTEAQLFSDLMTEYSSPEMAKALAVLAENAAGWEADPQGRSFEDMVSNWARLRQLGSDQIDHARRRVSHFYRKVTRILEEGLVTGGLRAELEELSGRDLMHRVVIPLDRAVARHIRRQGDEDHSYIARFERLFPPRAAVAMPKERGAA